MRDLRLSLSIPGHQPDFLPPRRSAPAAVHSRPMPAPRIVHDPADLVDLDDGTFVPTMGALHDGHLSLIRRAGELGGPVVTSVFVNPTQFAPGEDFDAYPRGLERDVELAASAGAQVVYAPNAAAMYPEGPDAAVAAAASHHLPPVAVRPGLEDADRPRFFGGVCLVVARLLRQVHPAVAVFGEKDWQQLQVVRAMVTATPELAAITIEPGAIVRDPDGLAMSSRNARIPSDERDRALGVPRALQVAHAAQHPDTAERLMRETLEAHGLEVDYAVVRDPATLEKVTDFARPTRALVAARLSWDGGSVRLIDNAPMTVWR